MTCTRADTNEMECYDNTESGPLPVADCYNFPLNLQAQEEWWTPIQQIVDVVNAIGTDPSAFMTEQREAYIAQLRQDVANLD